MSRPNGSDIRSRIEIYIGLIAVVKVPLDARKRSICTSNYWDPAFTHLKHDHKDAQRPTNTCYEAQSWSTVPSPALCWLSHAGGIVHQTFNTRWPCLPSGFGTCVEQPAVVCQECTVTDDVPSRAEERTFPVVVWQWLGDRDCTAQYNCCLPATTECRRFCRFVCFSFLFNFVRFPCNVFDVIVSP